MATKLAITFAAFVAANAAYVTALQAQSDAAAKKATADAQADAATKANEDAFDALKTEVEAADKEGNDPAPVAPPASDPPPVTDPAPAETLPSTGSADPLLPPPPVTDGGIIVTA